MNPARPPWEARLNATRAALYPETQAGGFTRVDPTIQFYARVNALMRPDHTVLDFGAGRGRALMQDNCAFRVGLMRLRGRCAQVIGLDVDPAVMGNPGLDQALVYDGAAIPLPDDSVDLIVADCVFEHLEDPARIAAEFDRVLRPGGWVCARTPNLWGYVSIAARLIPDRLHAAVLRRVMPQRKAEDVFPTHYRLNSRAALRAAFPPDGWLHCSYVWSGEPAYAGVARWAWMGARAVAGCLPPAFGTTLNVFLQKRR